MLSNKVSSKFTLAAVGGLVKVGREVEGGLCSASQHSSPGESLGPPLSESEPAGASTRASQHLFVSGCEIWWTGKSVKFDITARVKCDSSDRTRKDSPVFRVTVTALIFPAVSRFCVFLLHRVANFVES